MANTGLQAVIFDVDGTLAHTERDGHRVAFNRAFEELGFSDRWDADLYGELVKVTGGGNRIAHYFTSYKGLDAADAEHLAAKIQPVKTRLFVEVAGSGSIPPRPGLVAFLVDLFKAQLRLAIATTGSRAWVIPLVEGVSKVAGLPEFEAIVTGNDVERLKPFPDAYQVALERLSLESAQVVAIEDSKNGVRAAKSAGCLCLAVKGEYADPSELEAADLVVDDYGEQGAPLKVLTNPHHIPVGDALTAETVRQLHLAASASSS